MALRINFYGGPGVGKSTLAARVFAGLKQSGVTAELVTEFIKPWAYEGIELDVFEHMYIFGNQLRNELRFIKADLDVVVTDSPILLQGFYISKKNESVGQAVKSIALDYEDKYPTLNFFVYRSFPYDNEGRYQDGIAAKKLDIELEYLLQKSSLAYYSIYPDQHTEIIQIIQTFLEQHNND